MNRAAALAAATTLIVAGLIFSTSMIPSSGDERFNTYQIRFFSGGLEDQESVEGYASTHLWVSPPHFPWMMSVQMYGCEVDDQPVAFDENGIPISDGDGYWAEHEWDVQSRANLGEVVSCRFDIPKQWGCAEAIMFNTVSIENDAGETLLLKSPSSGVAPLLFGDCPEPPLPVVNVSEPGQKLMACCGILAAAGIARLRKRVS